MKLHQTAIARTLKPHSFKSNMQMLISSFSHSPLILVSGRDRITQGIDFFNDIIINTTIPL